jgi:hypothetical protein
LTNWRSALLSLKEHPRYTLMRGMARFAGIRRSVAAARKLLQREQLRRYLVDCESRMAGSVFPGLDRRKFVSDLNKDGVALGLRLPAPIIDEIRTFAQRQPCYADRDTAHGFMLDQREQAQQNLRKPILVAQYFNTGERCSAIARLMCDPALQAIAGEFLQSVPVFVGTNLWWTFAVNALTEDRDRHAHLFHRDVDDFRFFKFFFYLTDVVPGEGAHVCVASSHRITPAFRISDRWTLRRYGDNEVEQEYSADKILEICGSAGAGFAENTLCIHKGRTPTSENRLLLQLQFGLFDYGLMHDRRDVAVLTPVA